MRAVDVHVHGRKAVGKAFRHKTLGREVITLVKIVFAEDMKNAGVTLETGRVQRDPVQQVMYATEPCFGSFERHAPHQSVDFIAQTQEIIGKVTPILTSNSCNQRSLRQRVFLRCRACKSYWTYSFTKSVPACEAEVFCLKWPFFMRR